MARRSHRHFLLCCLLLRCMLLHCWLLQLPLRAKVEAISFSAHADFDQTRQFLDELAPPHVVLVHGEFNEMMRLRTVGLQGLLGWH
jgi:Cft2 family RNA processing exonuclease